MAATDADALVLAALRQSGCLPESLVVANVADLRLRNLDADALVAVVSLSLARLQDAHTQLEAPPAPVGVAARHRVGSQLASAVKSLGYAGDCGYNHFLYPSEKETRSLLTWLVSKLPRAAVEGSSAEDASAAAGGASAPFDVDSDASASLLTPKRLQGIFTAWTRERTLLVLPNRELPGLRGFQRLPLETSPVELPWLRESSGEREAKGGFLFDDDFPSSSLRAASLLEALASNQRRSVQRMSVLDDEDDEAAAASRAAREARFSAKAGEVHSSVAGSASELRASAFAGLDDSDDESELGVEGAAPGPLGDLGLLPSIEALSAGMPTLAPSSLLPPLADGGALRSNENIVAAAEDAHSSESMVSEMEALTEAAEHELLEQMHSQSVETQQRVAKMRKVVERERRELETMQTQIEASKKQGLEMQRELAKRQQLIAMLPKAKENIAKLENICEANASKLKQLEAEWEAHRAPLLKEEAQLVALKSNRKARCRQFVTEMKSFRHEMKDMAGTIQHKMDALRSLERTYAQLPPNLNRNMYTARILEIIKQVHKQKAEIAKIIDDIKAIQKQLNFASEKLKRSEAVTEDRLFTAASSAVAGGGHRDGQSPFVACYRKFAEVRELFEELLLVVGDVGKKENAARDLENWISQLQTRDSGRHLDRVLADLESVQAENSALTEQLRAQKA